MIFENSGDGDRAWITAVRFARDTVIALSSLRLTIWMSPSEKSARPVASQEGNLDDDRLVVPVRHRTLIGQGRRRLDRFLNVAERERSPLTKRPDGQKENDCRDSQHACRNLHPPPPDPARQRPAKTERFSQGQMGRPPDRSAIRASAARPVPAGDR